MSRMHEIIETLRDERADQVRRLAWLDNQIAEFKAQAGEPVKPSVSSKPAKPRKRAAKPRDYKGSKPKTSQNASDLVEQYLREHPGSTAGEIAAATGLRRSSLSTRLNTMTQKGQLRKLERGYALPDHASNGSGTMAVMA